MVVKVFQCQESSLVAEDLVRKCEQKTRLHRDTEPVIHAANDPNRGYYIGVIVVARADTETQARSYLQVLADTRPPNALEILEQQRSDQVQDYAESLKLMPPHHRWAVDNVYLDNNVDFAETVKEAFTSLPKGGIAFRGPMKPISREPLQDMDSVCTLITTLHFMRPTRTRRRMSGMTPG